MTAITLGVEQHILIGFWKPLILLLPMVGWAWMISRVYDKHASRFHLARTMWNALHLTVGLGAFIAALAIPMRGEGAFWVGLGVMVLLLGADLVAYAVVANRDERVPEEHHIKFNDIFKRIAEAREAKAIQKRQGKSELVIAGPDKVAVPPPQAESPEYEVRVASESLVTRAMDLRASQMDIGPGAKEGAYAVSYLVDGVRQGGDSLPAGAAIKIVDFWKSCAKLDVSDRRRRLTGDAYIERGADRHKLRIVASGAQGGMRMTALFDPEKSVKRKAPELGLLDAQAAELRAIVAEGKGVVLLAAPPDMGRTTTLYTVLKMHDAYTSNVQTVESEPQDALEGVRQNVFEAKGDGPEYGTLVRSILRRDPQVVGVAELPDQATAKEIARADHERTRIYLSLRGDSALAAIQAWCQAVGELDPAAKALRGAVAQRLVRKLCVNCRVAYQPSADMLKKLGLPPEKTRQLYKKGGQVLIKNRPEVCPVCRGIGYIGQEGIFEVYRVGQAERQLIRSGNLAALRAEFRKRQLPSIQQAALRKAVEGTTSVEEVLRVTAEARPAPASPPKSTPPVHA